MARRHQSRKLFLVRSPFASFTRNIPSACKDPMASVFYTFATCIPTRDYRVPIERDDSQLNAVDVSYPSFQRCCGGRIGDRAVVWKLVLFVGSLSAG